MSTNPTGLIVLAPGAKAVCPHGGQMLTLIAEPKVLISGQSIATSMLPIAIAGCSFTTGTNPHPCTFVSGVQLSTRVLVNGKPVVLAPRPLLCQAADQAPQGTPLILRVTTKVVGT